MAAGDHHDCPGCGASTGPDDAWCGVCGLDLGSDAAQEMRTLAISLAATEAELNAIWARRNALAADLAGRRWEGTRRTGMVALAQPPRESFDLLPRPTAAREEWNPDRVRNLLLWLGATLLALSALAFTAVAWTHLGPGGRAVLLVAITCVSVLLASGLRTRLPATAGAFTGLAIALALIDWQVARRAGVASTMSGTAWWAIGLTVVGALSVGLDRVAAPAPARRAVAILFPGSAVLTVAVHAHAPWSGALGLAAVASALVVADQLLRRFAVDAAPVDPVVRATLRVYASVAWIVGAVLAIVAAFAPGTFVQTFTPAGVMLALAVTPALVLLRPGVTNATDRVPMAALVLASVIGAVLTSASTSFGAIGMLTFAAVLGGIAIAIAPARPEVWRRAAIAVGFIASGVGFCFAVTAAAVAELGPSTWLGHAWTGSTSTRALSVVAGPKPIDTLGIGWCAVAILAVAAAAAAITSVVGARSVVGPSAGARPARVSVRQQWRIGAVALALLAFVLTPVAAGASALVAFSVATGVTALVIVGSALTARGRPELAPVGLLALIPLAPAAGWAALTPATSITALSVAAASAVIAAAIGRSAELRAAHAAFGAAAMAALASVVTLASGASQAGAGFAGVVVAGIALLAGTFARRDTLDGLAVEIVGAVGMAAGALLAGPSRAWVAGSLTAMVPILLTASLRRDRTGVYASAAGGAALAATWAWLATAGVTVVEAYTLPAAALALGAGAWSWKTGRGQSWLNLGPAVVLALGPTLALAIVRNDDGRAIAVGAAAVCVLLAGAYRRLQAPLVLGTINLIVLGIDKLGPQAVRLPRWTMLALAGALLLWVGTTFERRRDGVQRAARRLAGLG